MSAEARAEAIRYVSSQAGGQGGLVGQSGEGPEGANGGGMFNVTEQEPNNSRNTAQHVPLGLLSNQFQTVNITGTNPSGDLDWFSFDLQAGDIIDIRLTTGLTPYISLYSPTGQVLATTTNIFDDTFVPPIGPPDASPLTGSSTAPLGLVGLHYQISTPGRYYARLSEIFLPYTANLKVYRPYLESQPAGTQQILFLDFDGDIITKSTFGLGPGSFHWGGVSDFVENFALNPGDVDVFIDDIIRITESKFRWIQERTTNSNFGLQILNSRDHGDLWGLPNVSRVMVGGSLTADSFLDDNEDLLGIGQSVDVGNFATEESAIVLIDRIAPFTFVPIFSSANRREYAATQIAEVIAHEAGHFFGGWHQALNSINSIMDWAANPFVALGLDGIWGTPDDGELHFGVEGYSGYDFEEDAPRSGQFVQGGVNDTINFLGWSLSTGTVGGNVEGVVYQDTNLSRSLDNKDIRLPSIVVYVDSNGNGLRDALETSTTTSADGTYSLRLTPGTYTIRTEVPTGYRPVAPLNNAHTVTVALNGTVSNRNFGYELIQVNATGRVWNDLNGNALRDPSEPGLGQTWVYIDTDGDCRLDIGEPSVQTNNDGTYTLQSPGAGTFFIRQVLESGRIQTHPVQDPNKPDIDSCSPIGHRVTLTGNPVTDALALTGLDFGNQVLIDYGDAPQSYGSASHGFVQGLRLGTQWDADPGPQYSANADGDDVNGIVGPGGVVIDDEDGVLLVRPLVRGSAENRFLVTATNTTGQSAYLNAWMDFNKNGVFDSGERIFTDLLLANGSHQLTFTIPASAQLGTTFARFRYSQERGFGATGFTVSGEVEDYQYTIVDSFSLALDDTATVQSNSALNAIDVLANDFRAGPGDVLRIVATSGLTSVGGQATINNSGDRILYTPPAGFIGLDSFTYTMENSFGERATATVVVTVNLFFDLPQAIDDSFDVPTNVVDHPLNVLANDIEGQSGALSIISVTQPARGGQISIATGGKSLRYTPARNFGGTEFFTYTAIDAGGNRTTATVTLHTLPGARLDDEVLIQLVATDLSGNPISAIEQGRDFKIEVIVDDLRFNSSNPGISSGVFSAYFDLLYNMQLVSLVANNDPGARFNFEIEFFNDYVNFTTGDASTPGVIDELGATSSNFNMQNPSPTKMAEITFTARSAGIVSFMPDPADGAQSDTLLFNMPGMVVPPERIRFLGTQVQVFGDGVEFPVAVDDIVTGNVPLNSIRFPVDVLVNDLRGSTGSISIVSVTQPVRGNVAIENRGGNPADQIVTYTPNIGFTGFEQFTYTIQDTRGIQSTAMVSLRVGDLSTANLIADFDLVVTDVNGQPIDQVTVGSQFQIRAFVQDVRAPGADRGLFTAYMDVLYNANLVSTVLSSTNDPNLGFVVSFGPTYGQVREGDVRVPGLINEIGAQSTPDTPVGSGRFLLFTVTMRADRVGNAVFAADPADVSPFHDTLTFIPAQPVPFSQTRFGFDSVQIVSASGGGSGEFHNSMLPLDVNNDKYVSAIDALLVINHLNGTGRNGNGEGESPTNYYPDTSGDGRISALDALLVINYLNSRTQGSGEGEGEGEGEMSFNSMLGGWHTFDAGGLPASQFISQSDEPPPSLGVLAKASNALARFESANSYAVPVDILFGQDSKEEDRWEALLDELAGDLGQTLDSGISE